MWHALQCWRLQCAKRNCRLGSMEYCPDLSGGAGKNYWQHAHGLQDALLLALLGGADTGHLSVS